MKLSEIARFEMCNPLELTYPNPICMLTAETKSSKSLFVKGLCKTSTPPNIIYFDGAGDEAYQMQGVNLIYKTTRTKEVFTKIDEICRFTQATGFKAPTLIIFDELEIESNLKDIKFQNDLSMLISKCRQYEIRIVFIQQEFSNENKEILLNMTRAHNIALINYQITCEDEKYTFSRIFAQSATIGINQPVIWFKTKEQFLQTTLRAEMKNKDNMFELPPSLTMITHEHDVPLVEKEIERRLNAIEKNEEPGCDKVYMIEQSSGLFSPSDYASCLDKWLRAGKELHCYFIIVGKDIPCHLAMLMIEI